MIGVKEVFRGSNHEKRTRPTDFHLLQCKRKENEMSSHKRIKKCVCFERRETEREVDKEREDYK